MDISSEPSARGERRRIRTRTALLNAAESLLSQRSADAVRMEDVAEVAGISPASVYVHFGTKDALVSAVIQRLLEMSMAELTAAYSSEGTAFEQVRQAGLAYMRLLIDHPALTRYLSLNAIGGPANPFDEEVAEPVAALRTAFEERIQAAVDSGEIRPLDSRLLSYFLFGAWNGVAALALREDGARLTAQEVEDCLVQARELLTWGVAPIA
ncbi:TetR/AcrR family transcriptional regulator [Mycobacteroides stephanolepidis]|uniref:TetR/AcrR family transcriptional regulator n=1 Tax=[Mycobacterium] stephanolepidis TaxID=1520670 RepID=UPI000BBB409C|nr:TetR/AcrR family transcriptional regulator [[Mycobacterium] stephanolepidis]